MCGHICIYVCGVYVYVGIYEGRKDIKKVSQRKKLWKQDIGLKFNDQCMGQDDLKDSLQLYYYGKAYKGSAYIEDVKR